MTARYWENWFFVVSIMLEGTIRIVNNFSQDGLMRGTAQRPQHLPGSDGHFSYFELIFQFVHNHVYKWDKTA